MANTDFLSFLVDETLKLQKSGEVELSSFELKLQDYHLEFMKGEFVPQTQMLRFVSPMGLLDFPTNWSVFSVEAGASDVVIDQDKDQDLLYAVLSQSWNKDFKKLLVTHADGFCYLVGLRSGEEVHLHDLLNPQELLKAA